MRRILWLVGQQQAGKTMLSVTLESYGAQTLHIGEALRKSHSVSEFAKDANPYAPEVLNARVERMIRQEIQQFVINDKNLLVIDSAPRNQGQFEILLEQSTGSEVWILREKYAVRKNRARKTYAGDMTLFDAREDLETMWMAMLIGLCKDNAVPFVELEGQGK